jgi:glycine/D-amino acid oxidase-like deaminating enzyme
MGEEKMWQIAEMRFKGIEKIRKTFSDELIDYDCCGGYECLSSKLTNLQQLEHQLHELNRGLKPITKMDETFVWANEKLASFDLNGFDAMIENKLEGGLHSGKLVQALTKKIQSSGVEILTGVQVKNWEENQQGISLYTHQGLYFKASQVIICSNAFSNQLLPQLSVQPARGQIIVTTPIDNLKMKGTFHYNEGFYYFRNVSNRILLGGARNKVLEEETTTEMATSEIIQKELERFLSVHLLGQQTYKIEYRWSGIMGFTENKEPLIKHITNRITAIIVCNGMGVALSPVITDNFSSNETGNRLLPSALIEK